MHNRGCLLHHGRPDSVDDPSITGRCVWIYTSIIIIILIIVVVVAAAAVVIIDDDDQYYVYCYYEC